MSDSSKLNIYALVKQHQLENRGFVIYKEPNSTQLNYLSGKNNLNAEEGFAFYPFSNSVKTPCFLTIEKQFKAEKLKDLLFELGLKTEKNEVINKGFDDSFVADTVSSTIDFNSYQTAFSKIKTAISDKKIRKAILSRIINHPFSLNQFADLLTSLFDKYDNAFRYVFYHETTGLWIGASPEIILKQKGNLFTTTSLAGTKASKDSKWGGKELDEHKIVTEYIFNELNDKGISVSVEDLKTTQAGEIFHLQQTISFQLAKKEISKQDLFQLINLLHPTPAIAGFPKKEALSVIKMVENHDRKYYCGFLGLVVKNKSELYVNLRCAEISKNNISVYVGGGITNESECKKEWLECERKSQTILSLF